MKKAATKKAATPAENPQPAAKPKASGRVTVRVVTVRVVEVGGIGEADGYHPHKSTFETTPERARALGRLVEIVGKAKAEKDDNEDLP